MLSVEGNQAQATTSDNAQVTVHLKQQNVETQFVEFQGTVEAPNQLRETDRTYFGANFGASALGLQLSGFVMISTCFGMQLAHGVLMPLCDRGTCTGMQHVSDVCRTVLACRHGHIQGVVQPGQQPVQQLLHVRGSWSVEWSGTAVLGKALHVVGMLQTRVALDFNIQHDLLPALRNSLSWQPAIKHPHRAIIM